MRFIIMAKTYGIISDLHNIDIKAVVLALQHFEKEEVDALVFNGDLIGERSGHRPQDYLATLLDLAGQTNLESYFLPGSHEIVHLFEPILEHFSQKYPNLINTLKEPKANFKDHQLVFLPGSDWRVGAAVPHGYSLEVEHETGVYKNDDGYLRVINPTDLEKLVSESERTIVFSHVPPYFPEVENGIDVAQFGEVVRPFRLNGEAVEIGSVFPGSVGAQLAQQGAPVKMKKENRGNKTLRTLYENLGIKKSVSAHFHESVGQAHDFSGKNVEENTFVDELFYNSSCLDSLQIGMVSVNDVKVAYENVNLKQYLR